MSRNLYSPPTSRVADIVRDAPEGDRRDVHRASKCLWYSFGVTPIRMAVDFVLAPSAIVAATGVVGIFAVFATLLVFFLITRWVVSRLTAGRNWMRLLVTWITALGALLPLIAWDQFTATISSPIDGILFGIQTILQFLAIAFLNTRRSRTWFAALRAVPA